MATPKEYLTLDTIPNPTASQVAQFEANTPEKTVYDEIFRIPCRTGFPNDPANPFRVSR